MTTIATTIRKGRGPNPAVTLQVRTAVLKGAPTAPSDRDGVPCRSGEMSLPEKSMLCMIVAPSEPLPYPVRPLKMAHGPDEEAYDIPEAERPGLLADLYPFRPAPDPEAVLFDIHEQKSFVFRDALVIRHRNRNLVVSPYYAHSGGMAVDFMPPDASGAAYEPE